MSDRHEPREAFVTELEGRLRADLSRRRLEAPARRWLPQSNRGLALATAAVVVISMAIGGGVVAAAYESQQAGQRDALLATLEQRADLAKRRLALASQRLRDAQDRIAVGVENQAAAGEARVKVVEAETEVKLVELDLAEVRATGREPMKSVSAPLVDGRDFVIERWQIEALVPAAALDLAKMNVQATRTRFEVGLANNVEVQNAESRLVELEAAVQLPRTKIRLRQQFLKGLVTPAVGELRIMEAEAEQQRMVLVRHLDVARRGMDDVKRRVEIGAANRLELAEAELKLQELQLAVAKADYDLVLIRKQLGR